MLRGASPAGLPNERRTGFESIVDEKLAGAMRRRARQSVLLLHAEGLVR
ncbi:MAG: hypothetical protein JHC40_18830 [Burkholderiales bacterium]|jgi:hypothetical protein|nr:hypothetical protein [Burkholderiales bacterium]